MKPWTVILCFFTTFLPTMVLGPVTIAVAVAVVAVIAITVAAVAIVAVVVNVSTTAVAIAVTVAVTYFSLDIDRKSICGRGMLGSGKKVKFGIVAIIIDRNIYISGRGISIAVIGYIG